MAVINKESTILYDSLVEHIKEIAKKEINLKKLVSTIKYITDKNTDVLNTNIVGYPLLVNEKDQKNILDCLELNKKSIIEICNNSPRLNGIGKILDQFAFALPLLLLSGELYNLNKKELSQGIFLFSFYRPYASKVASFFRLGTVDEKAMEYTTVVELDNRSYIKKYGSVYAVLVESARSAYDTYIEALAGKNGTPTDDMIYNNIFYSAIFSKTGSWLKALYGTYLSVKNSGKALKYEQAYYTSEDEDSGELEVEENGIKSNSAVKRKVVASAISRFNLSPINTKYVNIAATYGNGSPSKAYEGFLTTIINQVSEFRPDIIPVYFDAIVGSFLDSQDENGQLNLPSEISSVKFLAYSKRIFKVSNTNNSNIREEQNITEDILVSFSPKYVQAEIKTKRKLKLALFMYFVLFIQK